MKNLKNKIVLITGAGGGLGREIAKAFFDEGSQVVLSDINLEGLEETKKILGVDVEIFKSDVSSENDMKKLIEKTIKIYGKIDILVNNAGIALTGDSIDIKLSDWQRIIAINLWGPLYTINFSLPYMKKNNSGHIVNISSSAGFIGFPYMAPYVASKHALRGLSESLYYELKKYNIGVTAVCPGGIRTDILKNIETKGLELPDQAKGDVPKWAGADPVKVAQRIIKAVKRNKRQIIPTADGKIFIFSDTTVIPLCLIINAMSKGLSSLKKE